jgi:hypothetical protein
MGCIGVGGQGTGNMRAFLGLPDVQIVAICDVYKAHLATAMQTVESRPPESSTIAFIGKTSFWWL